MHYYQFNIGDYMSHTKGLTPLEDLAYRRMLDEYYLHESPLPILVSEIARQIGLSDKKDEVSYVLSKFFIETDKGYVNARAQKEIKKYKANQKKKSEAGKLSGKARRNKSIDSQQVLNTCLTDDELNINHKPITNNHKPVTNNHKPVTNNHKPVTNNHITKTRAAALDYSGWPSLASEQVLKDWLDMRRRLKANVSQTVINNFCTELHKAAASGYSVDQCLSECVTRNWRGFKFDWLLNSEAQNGNRKINNFQTRQTREQRMEQALNEVFGTTDSGALEGDFEKIVSDGLD